MLRRDIPGMKHASLLTRSLGCVEELSRGLAFFLGLPSNASVSQTGVLQNASGSFVDRVQDLRHYHGAPYAKVSGRPRPEPMPFLEPIKRNSKHTEHMKLHQSVIRFPEGVHASVEGNTLVLSGRAGTLRVSMEELDPLGLVAYKFLDPRDASQLQGQVQPQDLPNHCLLLLASPDKEHFQAIVTAINNNIQGCMQGYLLGITVKGVGYRLEPMEDEILRPNWYFDQTEKETINIKYPHPRPLSAFRLKVGFSRPIVYPLPPDIRAFSVKPTLLYLYGLQIERLQQLAQTIRSIRKPNPYTANGIQLVGEKLRLKQRAAKKK